MPHSSTAQQWAKGRGEEQGGGWEGGGRGGMGGRKFNGLAGNGGAATAPYELLLLSIRSCEAGVAGIIEGTVSGRCGWTEGGPGGDYG